MGTLEDAMLRFMAANPDLPAGEEADEQLQAPEKPASQTLHVLMERKGRAGKVATIIEGFRLTDEEVAEIASQLKKRLGIGGSSRGGEILLQGDRRREAAEILRAMGHTVKGA